ncbi:hypothetical protein [Leptospira ryugenii]|uniref:hypothetical protein n=1 Tax=Leptospira ryugenii TaxID=1917863 RepID=UPI000D58D05E|nr:hypothetical protein [Leptospira ryugenii]
MFGVTAFLYSCLVFFYGVNLQRESITSVLVWILITHLFFYLLWKQSNKKTSSELMVWAIFLRVLLMIPEPKLSDDYFRFLWDGGLMAKGISPFVSPPSLSIQNTYFGNEENLFQLLYSQMNSRDYHSVYPIALQGWFTIPWIFSSHSLEGQIFVLRVILMLFELGNLLLLRTWHLPRELYSIFCFSPLLLYEGIYAIHPDPIVFFFLLLCLRYQDFRFLFPLLLQIKVSLGFLIPGVLFLGNARERAKSIFVLLLSLCLLWFSLFQNIKAQGESGLGLFFHSFRFHSILEELVYWPLHLIGNLEYLSGSLSLSIASITFLWILCKKGFNLQQVVLLGLSLFTFFSPVIHPWYLIPLYGILILARSQIIPLFVLSIFGMASYFQYAKQMEDMVFSFTLFKLSLFGIFIWMNRSLYLQKNPS